MILHGTKCSIRLQLMFIKTPYEAALKFIKLYVVDYFSLKPQSVPMKQHITPNCSPWLGPIKSSRSFRHQCSLLQWVAKDRSSMVHLVDACDFNKPGVVPLCRSFGLWTSGKCRRWRCGMGVRLNFLWNLQNHAHSGCMSTSMGCASVRAWVEWHQSTFHLVRHADMLQTSV